MGFAARNIGQLHRSEDYFRRSLEVQDDARSFAPFFIAEFGLYDFLQGLSDTARADAAYRVLAALPDTSNDDPQLMGRFAVARGRLQEAERWANESERRAAASAKAGSLISARRYREDARVLRAYVAEARGDHGAVLRELSDSIGVYPGSSGNPWGEDAVQLRFELGRRLLAGKDFKGAMRYLDGFDNGSYNGTTTLGLIHLYRGRALEGLGDLDGAKAAYGNVVRWWKHCDPELVPIREQAREALARLTAEPAGTRGTR